MAAKTAANDRMVLRPNTTLIKFSVKRRCERVLAVVWCS